MASDSIDESKASDPCHPHDSIEKNTPASVPIVTAALILQRYLNVGLLRTEEEGHW